MSISFQPVATIATSFGTGEDIKIAVPPEAIEDNPLLQQTIICERFIADRSASIYFTQMMITYIYITGLGSCSAFERAITLVLAAAIINVGLELLYSFGTKARFHVWRSMILQIMLLLIINIILLAVSGKYATLIMASTVDSNESCTILQDRMYWFAFGSYITSSLFQILRIQFKLRKLSFIRV